MELFKALKVSASGMRSESVRLRVISENLANTESTARVPGGDPYRRKTVSFKTVFDDEVGTRLVTVDRIERDKSDFQRRYDPGHPVADPDGYVLMPNVNPMIELMDMREAQRTYEANLNVMSASRSMLLRTIDLLKS